MGALTEIEIFDRMEQSLKEAAELADRLAVENLRGPLYHALREHLSLIEGCARQAAAWRADARWLKIGMIAHECHERAGGWLRGYKDKDGKRIAYSVTHKNKMFVMLAINLRGIAGVAEAFKTGATRRVGPIIPEIPNLGRRENAPVGWVPTKSGLVVPGK